MISVVVVVAAPLVVAEPDVVAKAREEAWAITRVLAGWAEAVAEGLAEAVGVFAIIVAVRMPVAAAMRHLGRSMILKSLHVLLQRVVVNGVSCDRCLVIFVFVKTSKECAVSPEFMFKRWASRQSGQPCFIHVRTESEQ